MLRTRRTAIALGFGAGLSPKAPGTVGTLWAWLAFLVLQPWLDPRANGPADRRGHAGGLVGLHRHRAAPGRGRPRQPSSGTRSWPSGWCCGWPCPWGLWGQAVAFALFRFFDAAKPGPVGWADQLFKGFGWRGGWGILFDDFVAAFCTLLVIALWRFFW
jgi:phosphatidylglycerophosphatase A